jgi:hypothetical protein|tara:strand:- start:2483 stop:3199 length:717 start_codon:yes stop_codon:yes gene_type:complete
VNNIYIASYNRADLVRTYEYLGCGKIVVPKSQEEAYRVRYGDAVVGIDDELDGSAGKKRNAILDMIANNQEDGYGWIIDDDLIKIRRKKEGKDLEKEDAIEILEALYLMAKEGGIKYGGLDYSTDNMKLKDYQPFSLTKIVFGGVLVYANDNIRYDTRFRINEDVDFWVQKLNKGRMLLKNNQYAMIFHGVDGGADSVIGYNNNDRRAYATKLNNKWGQKLMVWNKSKFEFKTPIQGG